MASKVLTIARIAREQVSLLWPEYNRGAAGVDENGLCKAIVERIEEDYRDLVQLQTDAMIYREVWAIIKDAIHHSRPTAQEIAEEPQLRFPTFAEVCIEVYRDGDGVAIVCADMRKKAVAEAINRYDSLEGEVRVKKLRLIAIYREMDRRGFTDDDLVRKLYEQSA